MNGVVKIISSLKHDGFIETSRKIYNYISSKAGLRMSETYIFRVCLDDLVFSNETTGNRTREGLQFVPCENVEFFNRFHRIPDKIGTVPASRWYLEGAKCFVLSLNNTVVAYTWVHFNNYFIENAGTLNFDNSELFIGPFYTDHAFRGKGLYHFLMSESLLYCKNNNIRYVFGSSNSDNIATIKVCITCGFDLIGSVRRRKNERTILDFNKDGILHRKLI